MGFKNVGGIVGDNVKISTIASLANHRPSCQKSCTDEKCSSQYNEEKHNNTMAAGA
jgi:hypothetical protein